MIIIVVKITAPTDSKPAFRNIPEAGIISQARCVRSLVEGGGGRIFRMGEFCVTGIKEAACRVTLEPKSHGQEEVSFGTCSQPNCP